MPPLKEYNIKIIVGIPFVLFCFVSSIIEM